MINNLKYLDAFKVNKSLIDDIEWKETAKGGIMPSVVSTIEEKLKTCLKVVNHCSKIVLSILEQEPENKATLSTIYLLTNKLEEVKLYYEQTDISALEHRKVSYSSKNKTITILASTREKQIQARQYIYEEILKLLPLIEKLVEIEKDFVEVKGGYEIPESMMY